MKHRATPRFWECYQALPADIQHLADQSFDLLKSNPRHPSLHLKKVGRFWSARVTLYYRALAIESESDLIWFWIGTHGAYDKLIGTKK
jgi:hypothetical protein